jgi:hypothetical protein
LNGEPDDPGQCSAGELPLFTESSRRGLLGNWVLDASGWRTRGPLQYLEGLRSYLIRPTPLLTRSPAVFAD